MSFRMSLSKRAIVAMAVRAAYGIYEGKYIGMGGRLTSRRRDVVSGSSSSHSGVASLGVMDFTRSTNFNKDLRL
jgi:hypothetical protein